MPTAIPSRRRATARDFYFFKHPKHWPLWPFLPVVRRHAEGEDAECGLMFDAVGTLGVHGYDCTVFLCNFFELPETDEEFLALPRHSYDTLDELANDGWTVD
jgi:hypothetical protein